MSSDPSGPLRASDVQPPVDVQDAAAELIRSALRVIRDDPRRTGSVVWRLKDALDLLEHGAVRGGGKRADSRDFHE